MPATLPTRITHTDRDLHALLVRVQSLLLDRPRGDGAGTVGVLPTDAPRPVTPPAPPAWPARAHAWSRYVSARGAPHAQSVPAERDRSMARRVRAPGDHASKGRITQYPINCVGY
jgi:hypothetical protein